VFDHGGVDAGVVDADDRAGRQRRPRLGCAFQFPEGHSGPARRIRRSGNGDGFDQFGLAEVGEHEGDEILLGVDRALTVDGPEVHGPVQCDGGSGVVAGGVGLAEGAADCATVADARPGNLLGGLRQHGDVFGQRLRAFDGPVACERADPDRLLVDVDVGQLVDAVDVDDVVRRREPVRHDDTE